MQISVTHFYECLTTEILIEILLKKVRHQKNEIPLHNRSFDRNNLHNHTKQKFCSKKCDINKCDPFFVEEYSYGLID